jgi:hypothetical protein
MYWTSTMISGIAQEPTAPQLLLDFSGAEAAVLR